MSMNLLPWRTYQHQKRLRRLVFYFALFILLAINLALAFSNLIEQQKQNLQTQQKYFEQLNQQLHKTTTQIDLLRSAVKVGELSVTYSHPSAANGVENQRFSYVAQLLREFVREKGAMRRVLLERG